MKKKQIATHDFLWFLYCLSVFTANVAVANILTITWVLRSCEEIRTNPLVSIFTPSIVRQTTRSVTKLLSIIQYKSPHPSDNNAVCVQDWIVLLSFDCNRNGQRVEVDEMTLISRNYKSRESWSRDSGKTKTNWNLEKDVLAKYFHCWANKHEH